MLCVTLSGRTRACGGVTGGISDIAIFDPNDYNFTQATVSGVKGPYTAAALRAGTGATGTAVLSTNTVASVTIGSGGTGYVSPPTVVFTGGGGTGAAGTAIINGSGVVTGVTVTSPGTGYTTAPTVSFTGGGASLAGGGKMYLISFQADEAEWTWKQSVKGCAVKYEHEFVLQMPENEQGLTNFLETLDAAGCCCGLGIAVRLNSGKVFLAGEKYVNGSSIPRFTMKQDGSDGTSGKLFDDFNGANLHLKGSYSRNLYEYTGGWDDFEAFM